MMRSTSSGISPTMMRWIFRAADGAAIAADGAAIEDHLDSYHLVRMDGRWRFLDDTVHEPVEPAAV
jgi:hypothetical protein